MSKILRNATGAIIDIADTGISLGIATSYTIPPQDYLLWAASSDILSPVGSGDVEVLDGSDVLLPSDGIDLIKGITSSALTSTYIIDNLPMPFANTEYSYTFPLSCRSFEVRARNSAKMQLSHISGQSASTYVTIPAGASYSRSSRKSGTELTLHLQANKTNEVLEIIYWI